MLNKKKLEKDKRLKEVNELIKIIASHGRRFFYNSKNDYISEMKIDDNGKIWFKDDYTLKLIYTHKTNFGNKWKNFSHGGTLKSLVEMMRDYIVKGQKIPEYYIGLKRNNGDSNCWGYSTEDLDKVLQEVKKLAIIDS